MIDRIKSIEAKAKTIEFLLDDILESVDECRDDATTTAESIKGAGNGPGGENYGTGQIKAWQTCRAQLFDAMKKLREARNVIGGQDEQTGPSTKA